MQQKRNVSTLIQPRGNEQVIEENKSIMEQPKQQLISTQQAKFKYKP